MEQYQPNNIETIVKEILLENDISGQKYLLRDIQLDLVDHNKISFNQILSQISNFPIQNSMLFYLDSKRGVYVHIGNEPLEQDELIDLKTIDSCVYVKFRPLEKDQEIQDKSKKIRKKTQINKLEKRVKERQIKDVQDKVALWRELHEGPEKLNLDVAAQRVAIARKTLDDYHLQLRRAKTLNFDFEKHKFEKMGFLRKFVKDNGGNSLTFNNNNTVVMNKSLLKQESTKNDQVIQNHASKLGTSDLMDPPPQFSFNNHQNLVLRNENIKNINENNKNNIQQINNAYQNSNSEQQKYENLSLQNLAQQSRFHLQGLTGLINQNGMNLGSSNTQLQNLMLNQQHTQNKQNQNQPDKQLQLLLQQQKQLIDQQNKINKLQNQQQQFQQQQQNNIGNQQQLQQNLIKQEHQTTGNSTTSNNSNFQTNQQLNTSLFSSTYLNQQLQGHNGEPLKLSQTLEQLAKQQQQQQQHYNNSQFQNLYGQQGLNYNHQYNLQNSLGLNNLGTSQQKNSLYSNNINSNNNQTSLQFSSDMHKDQGQLLSSLLQNTQNQPQQLFKQLNIDNKILSQFNKSNLGILNQLNISEYMNQGYEKSTEYGKQQILGNSLHFNDLKKEEQDNFSQIQQNQNLQRLAALQQIQQKQNN